MKTFVLRSVIAASITFGVGGTQSKADPASVPPDITQITQRFFAAIRQNNAGDYEAVASGAEISYSDADDNKMGLDRARTEFPDCELAGFTDSEKIADSFYQLRATVTCVTGATRTQTVGIIADRERVYMVRPGGFEPLRETPAKKAKAEVAAQQALDWLASIPMRIPGGSFKSWSKKEQQVFPTAIQNSCTYIWTMAHDASAHQFPAAVSGEDEWALGVDVCVLGHMPADWPDREVRLQAARSALQRAAAAGVALRMPPTIAP